MQGVLRSTDIFSTLFLTLGALSVVIYVLNSSAWA
jgi:hypothetical protein